jgi:hypothetical protein
MRGFGAREALSSLSKTAYSNSILRLNGPNDPFKGSFGRPIVSIPFHRPIRLTFQFLERGDVVGTAGT